jgi:hypothetical protein
MEQPDRVRVVRRHRDVEGRVAVEVGDLRRAVLPRNAPSESPEIVRDRGVPEVGAARRLAPPGTR